MSTTDLPNGFIKNQSLTAPPYVTDNTLVDDPTVLVDDPVALVGNQLSIVEGFKPSVAILVPRPQIKTNR